MKTRPSVTLTSAANRDEQCDSIREVTQSVHANGAKILMLVESVYPADQRVCNEATLLVSSGYEVSVIAHKKKTEAYFEIIDGVFVYRIPRFEFFKKTADGGERFLGIVWLKLKSFLGYLLEYSYFTTACFVLSLVVFLKRGFDVIHAHNPPDMLFMIALPYKLFGKKFIFDQHDLCPELYLSRYRAKSGMFARMLRLLERFSMRTADITIATNESYKSVQMQRGRKDPKNIFIVRNGPNKRKMSPALPNPALRKLQKSILCYIGSLNPQDGVDYLLRALYHLQYTLGRDDFHCVIMGTGDSFTDLQRLARELKLNEAVTLTGWIPQEELEANLAAADICVDPDPSSPLNDVSTWVKIMEYMAYGKPIISFDLKETKFSAQEAALVVPPNDELAFAKGIIELMDNHSLRTKMGQAGRKRVEEELQWSIVGENLLSAYKYLLPSNRPRLRLIR